MEPAHEDGALTESVAPVWTPSCPREECAGQWNPGPSADKDTAAAVLQQHRDEHAARDKLMEELALMAADIDSFMRQLLVLPGAATALAEFLMGLGYRKIVTEYATDDVKSFQDQAGAALGHSAVHADGSPAYSVLPPGQPGGWSVLP